jgi:hypothetical protein
MADSESGLRGFGANHWIRISTCHFNQMNKAAAIPDGDTTPAKSSRRFPMDEMGTKDGASIAPTGRQASCVTRRP